MSKFQTVFFAKRRNPYYVVAPRYVRTSAGIKALHFICHALNRMGEQAFLIIHPHFPSYFSTHPALNTPQLTKRVMDYHRKNGLTPITIYPETIRGNPLNAPFVVRYVLNYAGLLGGDERYAESEYCISYSEAIAATVPQSRHTIFIPASDPQFFTPPPAGTKREGGCFYACKYKYYHGGKTFAVTEGMEEIVRDRPDAQTPEQIRDLFQRCEVFYCYENSASAIEAMLCGCPVVFLPNEYFTDLIGKGELGTSGYVWGNDPVGLQRAKDTVAEVRERYMDLFARAEAELRRFVDNTQAVVQDVPYAESMSDKYVEKITALQRYISIARTIWLMARERGPIYTTNVIKNRLKSGRIKTHEI